MEMDANICEYDVYNAHNQLLLEKMREAETPEERECIMQEFVQSNKRRLDSMVRTLQPFVQGSSVADEDDLRSECIAASLERFIQDANAGEDYDTFFFMNVTHSVKDTLCKTVDSTGAGASRSTIMRRLRDGEEIPKAFPCGESTINISTEIRNGFEDMEDIERNIDWEIAKESLSFEESYVLMALYGLQMSRQEISERLGITPRAISYIKDTALAKSRRVLGVEL